MTEAGLTIEETESPVGDRQWVARTDVAWFGSPEEMYLTEIEPGELLLTVDVVTMIADAALQSDLEDAIELLVADERGVDRIDAEDRGDWYVDVQPDFDRDRLFERLHEVIFLGALRDRIERYVRSDDYYP
ncbi:MAG: hypothetical protein AAF567_15510 [Actinomycetota bacterium]